MYYLYFAIFSFGWAIGCDFAIYQENPSKRNIGNLACSVGFLFTVLGLFHILVK